VKQIKDYINKEVAVYCDSQEEWNQMVELISKEIGIKCKPNRNYSKNTTNTLNLNNINKISSNIGVSDKGGYPAYTNYLASDFLEFQLPKCFYILRNDVVDKWLSKLSNGGITYSSHARKEYPYFIIEDLKYTGNHYRTDTTKSYPEITFEQFQKYVLKEKPSDILEQERIKQYPLTKEECTFDLRNTKIWIGDNPELSKKVQEKAFELGYSWTFGEKKIFSFLNAIYFYPDKSLSLTVSEKSGWFTSHDFKEIFPSDLGIYEKIPELPNTIDVVDLKRSDVLSENILDFPTANKVIYSTPKVTLTELELPAPIKVIKREESYY